MPRYLFLYYKTLFKVHTLKKMYPAHISQTTSNEQTFEFLFSLSLWILGFVDKLKSGSKKIKSELFQIIKESKGEFDSYIIYRA